MSGPPRVAAALGRFVASLTIEALPRSVIEAARERLLDFAGVTLAGQALPEVAPWIDYSERLGGRMEAGIIGRDRRSSAFGAGLSNGAAATALELDDGHIEGHVHPGSMIIPATLAVAEREGATAADLLTAMVTGYEIAVRVGEALSPTAFYVRGSQLSSLAGSFGSAAAASRARGLDAEATAHALEVAALTPAAPMVAFQEGSSAKFGFGGWPSALGVLAADLAAEGVSGAAGLFEDRLGLMQVMAERGDPTRFLDRLGERWTIMETYTKVHASCSHSHSVLDAVLDATARRVDDAAKIRQITVETYGYAAALNAPTPHSAAAAQFSIPFSVAALLLRGSVGPDTFTPERLVDPELLELAGRVQMIDDPTLDRLHHTRTFCRPARVTVWLADGRRLTAYREVARGWAQAPLTRSELAAKFRSLAGLVAPADTLRGLETVIGGLGADSTPEDLFTLLRGPYPPSSRAESEDSPARLTKRTPST